jgi:cell division transport system ATP-binding protein
VIYFDNVSKVYKNGVESVALDSVTLTINPKEFVSIVGHAGAGKTTLLKMILAEEAPSSGAVFFESVDISKIPRDKLFSLRRKIGTVFQDYRLIPGKTAYENIAFAMEASGRADDEIAADVPHVLELVDLTEKAWSFPNELSGGERQRVAIGRAIVNQPDVLLADEPTGNLDPINTYQVVEILKRINELGTTVVLTSHNKGVVDSLEKRVVTLDKGRVVRDDKDGRYVL